MERPTVDRQTRLQTIKVAAGRASSGRVIHEELLVANAGSGRFILQASPGLVLGLARGDTIIYHAERCEFDLVRRGGDICVQVFVDTKSVNVTTLVEQVESTLKGTWDGKSPKQVVFSISFKEGFEKIEQVFCEFVEKHPEAEWYYGNVYDEKDGITPVNWWTDM